MTSFEAAFGQGGENIASSFVQATQRARVATTSILTRMNEWAQAGWSAIPNKRALGIGTAVGVGLAVVLSEPAPSLGGPQGFEQPSMRGGSGGYNQPGEPNVHPVVPPTGSPAAPQNITSAANRGHISPNFRVRIGARAMNDVDTRQLQGQLRSALGGRTQVNTRVMDDRRSLTPQHVADIMSRG